MAEHPLVVSIQPSPVRLLRAGGGLLLGAHRKHHRVLCLGFSVGLFREETSVPTVFLKSADPGGSRQRRVTGDGSGPENAAVACSEPHLRGVAEVVAERVLRAVGQFMIDPRIPQATGVPTELRPAARESSSAAPEGYRTGTSGLPGVPVSAPEAPAPGPALREPWPGRALPADPRGRGPGGRLPDFARRCGPPGNGLAGNPRNSGQGRTDSRPASVRPGTAGRSLDPAPRSE